MTAITMEKHILKRLDALEDFAKEIRAALAAPATTPEFPADWAQMIHYPECWDTAAYPELRDAIHEALAWSGCSVCNPATAPERKPMTDKEIAAEIVRSPDPMAFGNLPAEGWRPMVRLVEAFHGITKLAPTGSELPTNSADQAEVTSRGQIPAWHDAPTVPGLWVSTFSWMAQKLGRETVEFYAKNRSIPSRRWYGPIPEDKP